MIHELAINNFLGTHNRTIEFGDATLIAGPNGSGKTTIAQAIRFALGGDPGRIAKKGEYKRLLTDGQKAGAVGVLVNDIEYTRSVGTGNYSSGATAPQMPFALPYAMEPDLFAALDDKERRKFLFQLMGIETKPTAVADTLVERGSDPKQVDQITPLLRAGFEAACDAAKGRARDAKAAWKEVTGEQWGSEKASLWRAPKADPVDTSDIEESLAKVNAEIDQLNQQVGAEQSDLDSARQYRGQLTAEAGKLQALQNKETKLNQESVLAHDRMSELGATVEPSSGHAGHYNCPGCDMELTVKLGQLVAWEDEGPESQEITELRATILGRNSDLAGVRQAITKAEEAKTKLAELEPLPNVEQNGARDLIEQLKDRRGAVQADLENAQGDNRKAEAAASSHARADQLNAEVGQWLAIAEQLAPTGIPAEMLSGALTPINERLAAHAGLSGWPVVQISDDMSINYGTRAYELCSESEQWRVNAMIGAAIASIADVGPLILDRVDVLDLPNRGRAMDWINKIEVQVIAIGTFKALPNVGARGIAVHWLGPVVKKAA
jgi:energy-coupling factor transporter ATP-binding protein EcfA2